MKVGEYIIEECQFCGNKTKLDILGLHDDNIYIDLSDENDIEYEQWIETTTWMMLKCSVCNRISLGTEYIDQSLGSRDLSVISMAYPKRTYEVYHMPQNVFSAYSAAIKAKHIDGAICLLSLRRTLEVICKEQGEITGSLVQKVRNLADKGILPSVLKEASDLVRHLGNAAAHGDTVEFSKREIERMIEFVESIIEYIYVLPEKISELKNT